MEKLCKDTLRSIINDCNERMLVLENTKKTRITDGRISELQLCIIHLQDLFLKNLNNDKE